MTLTALQGWMQKLVQQSKSFEEVAERQLASHQQCIDAHGGDSAWPSMWLDCYERDRLEAINRCRICSRVRQHAAAWFVRPAAGTVAQGVPARVLLHHLQRVPAHHHDQGSRFSVDAMNDTQCRPSTQLCGFLA